MKDNECWLYFRKTQKRNLKGKGIVGKWFEEETQPKISADKKKLICDILAKYVVPVISILFMTTYWSTGLYLYYFPTNKV